MFEILTNLLVLFLFAWLARSLLGARELTWRRVLLAALAGIAVGDALALALLVEDFEDVAAISEAVAASEFRFLALPFQIVATMAAIVVLELLFARPRGRRRRWRGPLRAIRRSASIVARAWQVSRIALRHGLGPLLGLRGGGDHVRSSPEDLARRARQALEEAGGMFIKLGQLLATRPDLLPPAAMAELGKLHSVAAPLPRDVVEETMRRELGRPVADVFTSIEWQPLGSASIAQAHAAQLLDGTPVVVKVRRPGLRAQVDRDLAIARWLARSAARRSAWGRAFDVRGLTEEFSDALLDELDFRIEGRHIAEVAEAVASEPRVYVPRVVGELTSAGVLVMERLAGVPLAQAPADEVGDADALADALCASQISAMLHGQRFHGDPHPGNLLLLEDGRLGLIDMGITGRLDAFERAAVFQMLVALRLEDPTLLYESMLSIGAVDASVHDPEKVQRALAQYLASWFGPRLPPPEALTQLLRLTAELGLVLPRSTTAMFRAMATLTGTLEHLRPGYPVIEKVADVGGDEFRRRLMPASAGEFLQQEWAQLAPLVSRLPRHVDRIATLLEHGRITTRLRLFGDVEERRFLTDLVNRIVLAFLSIGTAGVSVVLLRMDADPDLAIVGASLYQLLGWIGLFLAVVLLLRVLLDVLRSSERPPVR